MMADGCLLTFYGGGFRLFCYRMMRLCCWSLRKAYNVAVFSFVFFSIALWFFAFGRTALCI